MSRGIKRDSYGNRSFNNRGGGGDGGGGGRIGNLGGGGGGMGGNMGSGMGGGGGGGGGGGSGGMNPWEGGMMPGRGILPTPNNNLSLASPHTQLAIASNLLSNLLRTQQEVQPQQVPSLLSLGNNFSGPGPNFPNQQNFSSGRFNDRPVRHPMKNQRPQPYKMGNRARDGPAGRRGPSAQQSRAPQSGNQRMNGNQTQHRNDKSSKPIPASKQNQTAKKEQQDVKTSDNEKAEAPVVKSDMMEESEDKAHDWKNEKKEGEEAQGDKNDESSGKLDENSGQKADKSATEESGKEGNASEKDSKMTSKKSEARHAESRYAEVPMNHMFCHICNKHMWDGYSFENHLRGRAHQSMMEKLDESYKLKVDLMRHELRVAEEQREISLTNSKRRGKKVSVDLNVREYCTMCDLNFYGTLSIHRKSEKHQQLKTFLHPRCFPCLKEFPSRIEYDEHCLTPAHMKNAVQCEEQRKNKKKDKLAKGEADVRTAEDEEKDVGTDNKNEKEEDAGGEQEYITDITENLTEKKFKIPSYKYCRQNQISIGKSLIKEVQGFYCEKCRRFMLLAEDMNAHLRSITHYRNFVQEVKTLTATTETTEQKPSGQSEVNENTQENDQEYDGDWKRRKVAHSKEEEDVEMKDVQENSTENLNTQKKTDGDEKYDPLEADAESEEEEPRETENANEQSSQQTNATSSPEKKTPVDKMWADIDNDNDAEIGNLIDDGDEKEHNATPSTPATPTATPTPTPVTTSATTVPTTTTDHEKSILKVMVDRDPNLSMKPARGRGFVRGRGNPRARRARR